MVATYQRPAKKHGTNSSYNKGCRCSDCRAASLAYQREYRQRIVRGELGPERLDRLRERERAKAKRESAIRAGLSGPKPPIKEHGTTTSYSKGCRCDECRIATVTYQREYTHRIMAGEFGEERRLRLIEQRKRWAVAPEKRAAWKRQTRANRRALLDTLKDRPCMDCGVKYPPYVMQFDHRPGEGKEFCIGVAARNKTEAAIHVEVAKCDVVCANCHAARTWTRAHPS